jgi:RNA polymerase sigma factor (sigma-70 family)
VKAVPGTVQGGGATFGTTHWSVIAACCAGSETEADQAEAALAQLCRNYWPPLYSFVRRRGFTSPDAQDLVQGFFSYFLKRKGYAQANPSKGKFRSFLLASIKNYIADVWDHENAIKRGGQQEFVIFDAELHVIEARCGEKLPPALLDEEQEYDRQWAAALVASAMNRLEVQYRDRAKAPIFAELKCFISGGSNLPRQEDVAEKLGVPIDTLRSHLSRLRARYRELLREEVARTIALTDDVDEELRHLRGILAAEY